MNTLGSCASNPRVLVLAGWLFLLSLAGFLLMATDKVRAAQQRRRRIPEKTFFLISGLGGFVGVLLAISAFRHKINKLGFILPVIGASIVWVALLWKLLATGLCVNP